MEYIISDRLQGVKGSIIRELFKLMKDPNIISFGGGNPSAETFPVEDIARITSEAFEKNPIGMLQYGLSEGYDPLRETMKAHLTKNEGFDFTDNELFIVSGGQQAADLTAKVFLNEADVIITEEPSFIGCMNTFRSYNAKLVGVPMRPDGMDIDKLEAALKANPDAKLLYIIPNFQNPTGYTTSAEKRKAAQLLRYIRIFVQPARIRCVIKQRIYICTCEGVRHYAERTGDTIVPGNKRAVRYVRRRGGSVAPRDAARKACAVLRNADIVDAVGISDCAVA